MIVDEPELLLQYLVVNYLNASCGDGSCMHNIAIRKCENLLIGKALMSRIVY